MTSRTSAILLVSLTSVLTLTFTDVSAKCMCMLLLNLKLWCALKDRVHPDKSLFLKVRVILRKMTCLNCPKVALSCLPVSLDLRRRVLPSCSNDEELYLTFLFPPVLNLYLCVPGVCGNRFFNAGIFISIDLKLPVKRSDLKLFRSHISLEINES